MDVIGRQLGDDTSGVKQSKSSRIINFLQLRDSGITGWLPSFSNIDFNSFKRKGALRDNPSSLVSSICMLGR